MSAKSEELDAIVNATISGKAVKSTPAQKKIPIESEKKLKIVDEIVHIAIGKCDLFIDEDENAYASFSENGSYQTWPLNSKSMRRILGNWYLLENKTVAKSDGLKEALETLQGLAIHGGTIDKVFLRTAKIGSRYYVDLADSTWRVIEIRPDGWSLLDRSPVKFIRPPSMRPLPEPDQVGSTADSINRGLEKLWSYLNIKEVDRVLLLAFIVGSLRHERGLPILELLGGQGTGKSSATDFIRMLIDPNKSLRRALPHKIEDVFVVGASNWVMTYENVSNISEPLQDGMCTISTGGGFAKRGLYSNFDEVVVDICRPQIINGISQLITRQDLADRAISIELSKIADKNRRPENEMLDEWANDYPYILGTIFSIFSNALKLLPDVNLSKLPRLATFGKFGEAVGIAAGFEESFAKTYTENQTNILISVLENSPACVALQRFSEQKFNPANGGLIFSGSFSELLGRLDDYRPDGRDSWPKSGKGLSHVIKRNEPGLSLVGVKFIHSYRGNGRILKTELYYDDTCPN